MVAGVREVVEAVRLDAQGARRDLVQQRLPDVDQRAVDQRDRPRRAGPTDRRAWSRAPGRPRRRRPRRCGAAPPRRRHEPPAARSGARSNTSATGSRRQIANSSDHRHFSSFRVLSLPASDAVRRNRAPQCTGAPGSASDKTARPSWKVAPRPVRRGRLHKCTRDLPNHKRLCCNAAMRKCRISITQARTIDHVIGAYLSRL